MNAEKRYWINITSLSYWNNWCLRERYFAIVISHKIETWIIDCSACYREVFFSSLSMYWQQRNLNSSLYKSQWAERSCSTVETKQVYDNCSHNKKARMAYEHTASIPLLDRRGMHVTNVHHIFILAPRDQPRTKLMYILTKYLNPMLLIREMMGQFDVNFGCGWAAFYTPWVKAS